MSTMISEVYDAFISSGAPEEKARAAAGAVAEHETRFMTIEKELAILKWMVGFNLVATIAVLLKLLSN